MSNLDQNAVKPDAQRRDQHFDRILSAISDAASRLRFGSIQLTVHEGRIVQLDVTEKQRFN